MTTPEPSNPPPDRRTAIVDAAIDLLAVSGTRGLTHRQIDRVLGIPDGSTGAYHRTRQELLEATMKRIVEIDSGLIESSRALDPEHVDLADVVTSMVLSARDPVVRNRTLARNVLFLEAAHNSELARLSGYWRAAYSGVATEMLRQYGFESPELPARALGLFMAGLILEQAGNPAEALSPEDIAFCVKRFLDGFR